MCLPPVMLYVPNDRRLARAFRRAFADIPRVSVYHDRLFSAPRQAALVLPSNGFGWLDDDCDPTTYADPIDSLALPSALTHHILKTVVRDDRALANHALIVPTGATRWPWFVLSPDRLTTVEPPATRQYHQGFLAVLQAVAWWNIAQPKCAIPFLACPAFAIQDLTSHQAAHQMRAAWDAVVQNF